MTSPTRSIKHQKTVQTISQRNRYNFTISTKGLPITFQHPSLLEQFRSFQLQNHPDTIEKAIEYFAVFGGLGWEINTDKPLMQLIETVILDNYHHLHKQISDITLGDNVYHALLSGIALGDRRTHSAFKRARLSEASGKPALRFLCHNHIINLEPAPQKHNAAEPVSDKVSFSSPFMRFWFAFVSPLFKGIQEGDYHEVEERFANRAQEFTDLIFEQLAMELLKKSFQDDPIIEIGSYWDKAVEIAVVAKTASGKVIAGECKYTNAKLKKNELTKLQEKCALAGLEPEILVLFSKRGFSNELKSLKGEALRLYSGRNFITLFEQISPKELIKGVEHPS